MERVKNIFITKSAEETQKLAEELIKGLNPKKNPDKVRVIALCGELGAGKTTFVQGLAKGLGIKRRLISPTFIIVRKYKIKIKNQKSKIKTTIQNLKFFFHVDLYRAQTKDDIRGLGLEEIINNSGNIVAIEWAEKMGDLLPENRIDIKFEYRNEGKRKIIINSK